MLPLPPPHGTIKTQWRGRPLRPSGYIATGNRHCQPHLQKIVNSRTKNIYIQRAANRAGGGRRPGRRRVRWGGCRCGGTGDGSRAERNELKPRSRQAKATGRSRFSRFTTADVKRDARSVGDDDAATVVLSLFFYFISFFPPAIHARTREHNRYIILFSKLISLT